MSAQPLLPPVPVPSIAGRLVRVEYLDFQNVPEHREFRLRVYGADGSAEYRFRIAIAAFGPGRLRLQDGPDVCYQKLLRAVGAGETASPDVITIDDVEIAAYRTAHTHVPKHRSQTWSSPTPAPAVMPRRQPPTRSPRLPVAPPVPKDTVQALGEGQRVSHAAFGAGVTTSTRGGHTVVCFDHDGPKTFVSSMLELDVLSAPHTWETGPRGVNRPLPDALGGEDRGAVQHLD